MPTLKNGNNSFDMEIAFSTQTRGAKNQKKSSQNRFSRFRQLSTRYTLKNGNISFDIEFKT